MFLRKCDPFLAASSFNWHQTCYLDVGLLNIFSVGQDYIHYIFSRENHKHAPYPFSVVVSFLNRNGFFNRIPRWEEPPQTRVDECSSENPSNGFLSLCSNSSAFHSPTILQAKFKLLGSSSSWISPQFPQNNRLKSRWMSQISPNFCCSEPIFQEASFSVVTLPQFFPGNLMPLSVYISCRMWIRQTWFFVGGCLWKSWFALAHCGDWGLVIESMIPRALWNVITLHLTHGFFYWMVSGILWMRTQA